MLKKLWGKGTTKWAIPFFVRPPLWKVVDFQPDFLPQTPMEGSGFYFQNYDTIHRDYAIPAGFFPKKGYGRVWIFE